MAGEQADGAALEAAAGEACRICGHPAGNRLHRAREMLLGTRDAFAYAECAACGTLQIETVPDLGTYYGEGYYSLRPLVEEDAAGRASLKKRLSRRAGAFMRGRAGAYYRGRRAARRVPAPARPPLRAARRASSRAFPTTSPGRVVTSACAPTRPSSTWARARAARSSRCGTAASAT